MTVFNRDGQIVEVELLRPRSWIDESGAVTGGSVHLSVEGLGVNGLATIHSIETCDTIQEGTEGQVVTGRFIHKRDNVLRIDLDGVAKPLEVTDSHHIWSVNHGDYIPAGELSSGDLLQLSDGTTRIAEITVIPGIQTVYNLEIHGQHVFRVTEQGLLVHNDNGVSGEAPLTSRAARRKVMRDQGIPTSQQPVSQSRNASGREYKYEVPTSGGGPPEIKSVQQQTLDSSHPGQGHWEAGGVKVDPITGSIRNNNYGNPRLKNDKSKANYQ
jgi:Pretoxin HINT domain